MVTRFTLPESLRMRHAPRQQRSIAAVHKIEQAAIALLNEGGLEALNTNAIAERAGVGIKSLYHFFPNKEAIVCRLAVQWLDAIHEMQADCRARGLSLPEFMGQFFEGLDALSRQHAGYGPLWRAMGLIPALDAIESAHEKLQEAFWMDLLREQGCRWPEAELRALVLYLYRTSDVAKQLAAEPGLPGDLVWGWCQSQVESLLARALDGSAAP